MDINMDVSENQMKEIPTEIGMIAGLETLDGRGSGKREGGDEGKGEGTDR